MLLHVQRAETLGLINERSLLRVSQQLPLGAESLTDLRVVHLWVLLCHLPALSSRPDHEGVHRALHVVQRLRHDRSDDRKKLLDGFAEVRLAPVRNVLVHEYTGLFTLIT